MLHSTPAARMLSRDRICSIGKQKRWGASKLRSNQDYSSGYYYLFFSAGICCGFDANRPASGEEYKIKVCRSTSASGGFVDKNGVSCTNGGGTVVLQSSGTTYGPGGQGVFTDSKAGGTILYYHYGKLQINRQNQGGRNANK